MPAQETDIVILLSGIGYTMFLVGFFSSGHPGQKHYHKVLQTRTFLFHVSATIAWAIIISVWRHKCYGFGPLTALAGLFLINTLLKPRLKRDVYLMVRGDTVPPDRKWFEYILAVALFLLSFLVPFFLQKLL